MSFIVNVLPTFSENKDAVKQIPGIGNVTDLIPLGDHNWVLYYQSLESARQAHATLSKPTSIHVLKISPVKEITTKADISAFLTLEMKPQEMVKPTRDVYVYGIPNAVNEDYTKDLFEKYGEIEDILYGNLFHRFRYVNERDAIDAVTDMDGFEVLQKNIVVSLGPSTHPPSGNTIYIYGLPTIGHEEVVSYFKQYGEIVKVYCANNPYWEITYARIRDAVDVAQNLHGMNFRGAEIGIYLEPRSITKPHIVDIKQ